MSSEVIAKKSIEGLLERTTIRQIIPSNSKVITIPSRSTITDAIRVCNKIT